METCTPMQVVFREGARYVPPSAQETPADVPAILAGWVKLLDAQQAHRGEVGAEVAAARRGAGDREAGEGMAGVAAGGRGRRQGDEKQQCTQVLGHVQQLLGCKSMEAVVPRVNKVGGLVVGGGGGGRGRKKLTEKAELNGMLKWLSCTLPTSPSSLPPSFHIRHPATPPPCPPHLQLYLLQAEAANFLQAVRPTLGLPSGATLEACAKHIARLAAAVPGFTGKTGGGGSPAGSDSQVAEAGAGEGWRRQAAAAVDLAEGVVRARGKWPAVQIISPTVKLHG